MSRHPVTILSRALTLLARAAGVPVEILSASASDWDSATFVGAEHRMEMTATPSRSLDDWLTNLPDTEFALPGHVVADVTVNRIDPTRFTLSVLTLVA